LRQSPTKPILLHRLSMLLDRAWIPRLPVYAFLIIHPSGPVLFDPGESPNATSPGYFPWWFSSIARLVLSLVVKLKEDVSSQLAERGIQPGDLKVVVLSRPHDDHAGGLPQLPGALVYLHQHQWETFSNRPIWATLEGAYPRARPTRSSLDSFGKLAAQ
jgi:glyoxylase-like metal-dependent hydrolase (beta-lactamase superfamily II)